MVRPLPVSQRVSESERYTLSSRRFSNWFVDQASSKRRELQPDVCDLG
jgi:hypothetical protein